MDYLVRTFGAKGDAKAFDTLALQKAIDTCAQNGGGRVVLESGKTYRSGSLILKQNVELHLEHGSVLQVSENLADYFCPNHGQKDGGVDRVGTPVTLKPSYAFIYAKDADNLAITGTGTIDGNAWAFVERVSPYYATGTFYPRPTLIYVEHCNHISFTGITLQNAPFWTLHPAGCDDVLISQIRILNDLMTANSDGIDPDHSTNVRILGCHVECADDCICLKTTVGNSEYGPTKNVIISDCTLVSTSAAIKIGTEGVGDFENILVQNCAISASNRGLSIQIRDGGNVKNVSFANISIETRRFAECWWGCAEPITITTHNRDASTQSGHIENIRFFNITCEGENGVFLSGNAENCIKDILFDNVRVTLRATTKWPRGQYDLRPGSPVDGGILRKKSPAMLLRYVNGATLRNCTLGFAGEEKADFAQGLLMEGCANIKTQNLIAVAASEAYEAIETIAK